MTLPPANTILQINSTPEDTDFSRLYFRYFSVLLALMPKTYLPAQHISQTLSLYYNPSKHLRKIKVENVLEEMRQGINRSLYITMIVRTNINKIPFLPLWKTHSF